VTETSVRAPAVQQPFNEPRTRLQKGIRQPKVYTNGTMTYALLTSTGEPQNLSLKLLLIETGKLQCKMSMMFFKLKKLGIFLLQVATKMSLIANESIASRKRLMVLLTGIKLDLLQKVLRKAMVLIMMIF
jgi:hypothetical protein